MIEQDKAKMASSQPEVLNGGSVGDVWDARSSIMYFVVRTAW